MRCGQGGYQDDDTIVAVLADPAHPERGIAFQRKPLVPQAPAEPAAAAHVLRLVTLLSPLSRGPPFSFH